MKKLFSSFLLITLVLFLCIQGCSNNNARYYLEKASFNYMRKEYDKTISNLKKALELEPENPEIYTRLGNVYIRQKEYDKAIIELKKALKIKKNYFDAIVSLGLLYRETGNLNLSNEYIDKAKKLKPDKIKDIDKVIEKLDKQLAKEKQ